MNDSKSPWDCPSAWVKIAPHYKQHLEGIDVRTVVELGVHFGWSLFTIADDFPKALVVGFDNFSYEDSEEAREHLNKWLSHFDNARLVECSTAEGAALWSHPDMFMDIDVLHIDGGHKYEEVSEDFRLWEPHVSPDGVVMFHDINIENFGVRQFFDELEGRKVEVTEGPGLGIWYKDA